MGLNHRLVSKAHPYMHLSPARKKDDIIALFNGIEDISIKICKGGILREQATVSLMHLYGYTNTEALVAIDAYLRVL